MTSLKQHLNKIRPALHKKLKESGFYEKQGKLRDKGRAAYWKKYKEKKYKEKHDKSI